MKPKPFAPLLVATAMAFASSCLADEELKIYTLKTPQGNFPMHADGAQNAFEMAANKVMTQIKPTAETHNIVAEAGEVQDETGATIGTCHIIGYKEKFNVELGTARFTYKVNCWHESRNDDVLFLKMSPTLE